jgi:hypothetical protein
VTEASLRRIDIARRVADAHATLPGFAGAFVTGSSAEGIADDDSDIDMSIFFHTFPGEQALMRAKDALDPYPPKWILGSFADEEVCLSISMEGIETQYGVGTVAQMDDYAGKILAGELGTTPEIKIAIGTLFAIPFYGHELIEGWKEQFRGYPENYRGATLEKYLAQRDFAELYAKIANRNAEIWTRRELIERVYDTFAALGALNRVWFSAFQLKRSDAWCAKLEWAPPALDERARAIAEEPLDRAIPIAIGLFQDARTLIRRHEELANACPCSHPGPQNWVWMCLDAKL